MSFWPKMWAIYWIQLNPVGPSWYLFVHFDYCWTMGDHVRLLWTMVDRCKPCWTMLDPIRPYLILYHFDPILDLFCWYLFVQFFTLLDHSGHVVTFFTLFEQVGTCCAIQNNLKPLEYFFSLKILDIFESFWRIFNHL